VAGIAGSYIAARLAPNRPMGHALVLGAFGLVVSVVGAVGDMEPAAVVRSALVFCRTHPACDPNCLGRWQTAGCAVGNAITIFDTIKGAWFKL
jgi:hypothetical protein